MTLLSAAPVRSAAVVPAAVVVISALSALVFAVFAVYLVAAFFVSWQDIRRNIRGDGRL